MRITQADFRTIKVEKLSLSFQLRYSLYQNGEMRYPESITCRGDTVVAYFLTSTIRDFIAETAHGFSIERYWNIVPEGSFGLSFCLEVPIDSSMAYLVPGVAVGQPVPQSVERYRGEQTCYANGLLLLGETDSLLVFSDPAASPKETGSIEIQRLQHDEEADFARIELRVPAAGEPLQRETRKGRQATQFFRSDGQFEYNLRLNVVTAPPDQIYRRGISTVLDRIASQLHAPPRLSFSSVDEGLSDQIENCLKMFLLNRDSLCGLLETKGANRISSLAGCTLALLQLTVLPEDRNAVELAMRLADFSLRGQHPRGLFYPYYWRDRQTWLPPEPTIAVSVHQSAAIALMLLRIRATLESKGQPASAYEHAASHMADSILQVNQDPEGLADLLYPDSLLSAGVAAGGAQRCSPRLIELFLELYKITGKDRYRKAVRAFKSSLFSRRSQPLLPSTLDSAEADLETILTEAQAAVALDGSGYPVKGLPHYLNALLSRIHLNRPDTASQFNPVGGINPALGNPTLLFRGFELAHTLLSLDARLNKSSKLAELNLLIPQLLSFTLQKPVGTSCFNPDQRRKDRFGSLNSAIWMRELYYMRRLLKEFPNVASV
jgi:hypothetical protein